MSGFRSQMRMRCTVQRNTAGTGAWNLPAAPGWTDHIVALACYAWSNFEQELTRGDQFVDLRTLHVYMPLHTDVLESDQLVSVTDRQGNVLFAGPLQIRAVERRPYLLDVTAVSLS